MSVTVASPTPMTGIEDDSTTVTYVHGAGSSVDRFTFAQQGTSSLNLTAVLGPVSFSAANVNLYSNSSAVTDWAFAGVTGAQLANTFQVDGGATTVMLLLVQTPPPIPRALEVRSRVV